MQKNIIFILEKMVWSFPLVFLLIALHIYFTIKLKFPQKNILKGIKWMFDKNDEKNISQVSSYKALMAVLAAMLGTGNIIGVATAISIGSVGSIFWIFISGILAMATKYAETYIVLKYRRKDKKGKFGGAMYVLEGRIGSSALGIIFSLLLIVASFGIGAMIQSNSAVNSIYATFGVDKKALAFIVTVICTYVIFGNERRISNISSILVPIATILYLLMCTFLLIKFHSFLSLSIKKILKEAFSIKASSSGIFSSLMIRSMITGISKGLFSNEAGMGSSPIFDATVNEYDIRKQSIISSTSVFIDTVFICSLTGLVLVSSASYLVTTSPIEMVSLTFSKLPFGEYLLTFCLVIFAVATIPCWGYYGSIGVKFLFKSRNFYMIVYKLIYVISIYLGAIFTLDVVWSMSAIANGLMVLPNAYALIKLRKEIDI